MNNHSNKSWTVAKFEFISFITNRSTQIATLVSVIIMALVLSLPNIISFFSEANKNNEKGEILIVNESEMDLDLSAPKEALPQYNLADSEARAKEDIAKNFENNKKLFGVFVIKSPDTFHWYTPRQSMTESPERTLYEIFKSQSQFAGLSAKGVTPEEAANFVKGPSMEIIDFAADQGKSQEQTYAYTYILVFLLYMTLIMYGQRTATSVAYEKGSRTMELLVTSTNPRSLIDGKVIGVGLMGIVHMIIFGITYLIFFRINQGGYDMDFFSSGLNMPLSVMLMAILCFFLAYMAFAYIFAALGSLVSRSEEISQVVGPPMMIIVVVFFAAIMATTMPEKSWVMVLSFVPFAGPLLLFVRFSMLDVPLWQTLLAIAVNILYLIICSILAAKVYRHGVLRYGTDAKSRDFLKILRQEKEAAN